MSQRSKRRPSKAAYRQASRLFLYLGAVAGERRSAADVARELPTLDQRTPMTKHLVQDLMDEFMAAGLAEAAPGPRGGKGWCLSEKGAALIKRVYHD